MLNHENMASCLANMASVIADQWEASMDEVKDERYASTYAQICTALAAVSAPKPFIQIGQDIFNRADIIRVAIEGYPDLRVCLYTREIQPGPENEGFSYSFNRSYSIDSDEGKALLNWLEPQIEVLA